MLVSFDITPLYNDRNLYSAQCCILKCCFYQFILFIILMSQNVMHFLLSPLLNLSYTTTWTGFVTVYSTWLSGDWGRAMVLWTMFLEVLISHPLIPISLDHFRSTWLGSDLQQVLCKTSCHLAKGT